ncbi:MAG: hypothetical protein AAGH40_03315 [Verrucomicrobiota bacterium]
MSKSTVARWLVLIQIFDLNTLGLIKDVKDYCSCGYGEAVAKTKRLRREFS